MSNVGKRGKVSLWSRLRTAKFNGTGSTVRPYEVAELFDAWDAHLRAQRARQKEGDRTAPDVGGERA